MKYKRIAAVLAVAAIIGSSTYAITDTLLFSDVVTVSAASTLRKNSSGNEVTALQNNLIKLGYLKSGSATGKFDTATEKAVKQFQNDYHLTADGVAGSQTLDMISSLVSGTKQVIEVKATLLNVRQTASPEGRLLTTVKAGQKFAVEGEASESDGTKWYKIRTGVGVGYICSDYVAVVSQATQTVSSDATSGILKVTGSVLNVRKSASTSSDKLYTVKSGQTYYFTNMKKVNGDVWYYIKVNRNVSGWVLGKWTTIVESTDTTTSTAKSGKLKVIVDILQVRQSTSTTSKRLYTTKRDEEYSYSNVKRVDGVDWYYIKVNSSISGWVLGTMVSATPKGSETTTTTVKTTTKVTSSDPNGGTLTVTANLLNVRESASTTSNKLFTAKKDTVYAYSKVKTVGDKNWYYIKVNNSISGWVIGDYVEVSPNSATTAQTAKTTSATTTQQQAQNSGKLTIAANVLNVRSEASTGGKIVTTVKKGSSYSYTNVKTVNDEKWYYIAVSSSKKGWVSGSYVTLDNSSQNTAQSNNTTTTASASPDAQSGKLTVNADLLNVRSDASTTSNVVTTVKKNRTYSFTKVKTVNNTPWYFISLSDGQSGWVIGTYVTINSGESPAQTDSSSGTLTVIGTSVNVRSGAGTGYDKVTTAKKGETYSFTDVKDGWYCIKLSNGKTGWIIADYVKVNSGTTTSATSKTTTASKTTTTEDDDYDLSGSEPLSADPTEAKPSATQPAASTTAQTGSTTTGVPVSPTAVASLTKTIITGTVKVSGNSLLVRSGPGSNYGSIGTLSNGTKVVIVAKGSKWHEIEYKNGTGYVSADCIKSISTQTKADSMSYAEEYCYIKPGQSINLGRSVSGSTVTYYSSDPKNCPVTDKGVASGVKEGLYTITAKCGSTTSSVCVVVLKNPNSNIKTLQVSEAGVDFIAAWEGGETIMPNGKKVFYPYKDVSGFWTVGYGHAKTSTASKSWNEERAVSEFNSDISKLIGDEYKLTSERPYLSEEAAKLLLQSDLNNGDYVKAVNNWAVRNGVVLNQVQFDALVSFCYNIGPSLWSSDSSKFYLKSAIISHRSGSEADPDQIIEGFCRYHKSNGKPYKGLWYRRRNEAELFLKGDYAIDKADKFKLPSGINWS